MNRERVEDAHFGERMGAAEGGLATMMRQCSIS